MLLRITEYCAWENEKWSYIIDLDKQNGAAINYLMIFIRCANSHFDEVKLQSEQKGGPLTRHFLFNRNPRTPFAASKYSFDFYDSIDQRSSRATLINIDHSLVLSNKSGYNNSTNIMTDRKISPAKMKSAMVAMRDKGQNKLYKTFDTIFLSTKSKTAA